MDRHFRNFNDPAHAPISEFLPLNIASTALPLHVVRIRYALKTSTEYSNKLHKMQLQLINVNYIHNLT